MDPAPLLEVEHLSRYYGTHCAVADLNFTLRRGEVLGFLGLNGAGKTSTLQMLSGNLAPHSGRIRIQGADLARQARLAKGRLGYLPDVPPLYPDLTVDEYLRYAARLHGVARRALARAVERARQRCGLEHDGRRLLRRLSKGYRQRVGIAQAIVHEPELVLLDEPTVGLDPAQIQAIRRLINDLAADHGVVLSTHILTEVEASCSHVLILHEGRVLYANTLAAIQTQQGASATLVEFDQALEPAACADLPGVTAVEAAGAGRWRLRHAAGTSVAEAVLERARQRRWGVRALCPQRDSLEQIFIRLTCQSAAGERHV